MGAYSELAGLEDLYLEDSYLLAVDETVDTLRISLEAVLTEAHPHYAPPKPNEAYCYQRLAIVFSAPRSVTWVERSMRPLADTDGEVDYGNIDSFTYDGDRYELRGEWGHLVVEGAPPTVAG